MRTLARFVSARTIAMYSTYYMILKSNAPILPTTGMTPSILLGGGGQRKLKKNLGVSKRDLEEVVFFLGGGGRRVPISN